MIWFEDEAGFYRQPTAAWTWAKAGSAQPRYALSHRSNTAVRVAAGFNPISGGVIHRLRSHFDKSQMGSFLYHIGEKCPGILRLYLVMDNWPVHHHEQVLKAVGKDERIQVLWLPTYAPWLNPTEKLWKWVRQKLTHMHDLANDFTKLKSRIDEVLITASENPIEMLQYTGTGSDKLYC